MSLGCLPLSAVWCSGLSKAVAIIAARPTHLSVPFSARARAKRMAAMATAATASSLRKKTTLIWVEIGPNDFGPINFSKIGIFEIQVLKY